jgi:DNA-binding NtrC family response regulator
MSLASRWTGFLVKKATSILLVDDDESLRGFVREVLVERGYEVVEAPDYDAAIQHMCRRVFPVILLDITLPGKSGLDVLEFVRRNRVSSAVIIVTGTAGLDLAIRSMALGATDYIRKPCTPNYLIHSIEHALSNQAA